MPWDDVLGPGDAPEAASAAAAPVSDVDAAIAAAIANEVLGDDRAEDTTPDVAISHQGDDDDDDDDVAAQAGDDVAGTGIAAHADAGRVGRRPAGGRAKRRGGAGGVRTGRVRRRRAGRRRGGQREGGSGR